MRLPKPMVDFNLSNGLRSVNNILLFGPAIGPPYFYYENVALTPKGVWGKISRFLFDIDPKFVDSKYFCAAARKRGYIHNLPLVNGSPLLPTPPKTIFDTFPFTKKWWSSWDPRRQFNCLQTCVASAKLLEWIRLALTNCEDPPPVRIQKYVLEECRKWNLVWVGWDGVPTRFPEGSYLKNQQDREIPVPGQLVPSGHCCVPPVSTQGHVSTRHECAVLVLWYWRGGGGSP